MSDPEATFVHALLEWKLKGRLESALRYLGTLTHIGWAGARQALERLHPEAGEDEIDEWLLRERYGEETSREVVELKRRQGYYERRA